MLKDREKIILPDLKKINDIEIDVIPDEFYKDKLKVIMGGKEALINRKDLFSIAFVIADPDTQVDLTPVKQTTIRKYVRQYRITAKKNIKKGEQIIFNTSFDVPLEVYEGLRKDIFEQQNKKRSPLLI
jgi:hypothetical protein